MISAIWSHELVSSGSSSFVHRPPACARTMTIVAPRLRSAVASRVMTGASGANVRDLTFAPLAPVITREATALRSRGATIVIVLAHAGGRCTKLDDPEDTSSCDQMAEIMNVAHQLPAGLGD